MNKLSFTPVTNIIGDDYFVCPKSDSAWERVIFKTNKLGAFLLSLLQEDITVDEMINIATNQFPDENKADITNTAIKVKNTILSLTLHENTLEVIEL